MKVAILVLGLIGSIMALALGACAGACAGVMGGMGERSTPQAVGQLAEALFESRSDGHGGTA